ncbi:MAG: sigma-70 family RNA polymerase sigma factor [Bacteroidaceae bacterium]|nr:sigma-70 family RNA polymerase sigma factor [Bacteroidaceae bacterium]
MFFSAFWTGSEETVNLTAAGNERIKVKVIDLRREYPGFVGGTPWALVTDMTGNLLEKTFGRQLKPYRPYLILSLKEGEILADFNRNEDKHAKRRSRTGEAFGYEEGFSETVHEELISDTMLDEILLNLDIEEMNEAMDLLSATQRRRVELYYLQDMTLAQVAAAEGVNVNAVRKSIKAALKILKEAME